MDTSYKLVMGAIILEVQLDLNNWNLSVTSEEEFETSRTAFNAIARKEFNSIKESPLGFGFKVYDLKRLRRSL